MSDERTPLLATSVTLSDPDAPPLFETNQFPHVLTVRGLSVTVKLKPPSKIQLAREIIGSVQPTKKVIVNNVSCTVQPGQLLAVLGASGSGKTSFLDAMACRFHDGVVNGDVRFNGSIRTEDDVKGVAAYVMQSDHIMPFLTVFETLFYVARLRLPAPMSDSDKRERVHAIIAELGLRHVTHSKVGGTLDIRGISGGERRRVSIGIQLLTDPSILFLDEPTSGLDAFNAFNIVSTLSALAKSQRTVVCTIHQPRSDIFKLFDLILVMSEGCTVYFGPAARMPDYFASLGYPCSDLANPCDHALSLATIDRRNEQLTAETTKRVTQLISVFNDAALIPTHEASAQYQVQTYTHTGHPGPSKQPGYRQFAILSERFIHNIFQGTGPLISEIVQAIYMTLLVGIIFYHLGDDQVSIRDRFSMVFIASSLYPFMVILDSIARFDAERAQFYCERQDGMYDILPYYFARFCANLPVGIVLALLYASPIYWMAGLQNDLYKFGMYLVVVIITVTFTRTLAVAVAAWIPTFHVGRITPR